MEEREQWQISQEQLDKIIEVFQQLGYMIQDIIDKLTPLFRQMAESLREIFDAINSCDVPTPKYYNEDRYYKGSTYTVRKYTTNRAYRRISYDRICKRS